MEANLDKIQSIFPEEIINYNIIDYGWANSVIEINNEWIFRFSRTEITHHQMELEQDFLPVFEKISPVKIPHIMYTGNHMMGYKKINGVPLKTEVLQSISIKDQNAIAKEIGSFLTSLHSFSYHHPRLQEFPFGGENFWEDLWATSKHYLSEKTQAAAKKYFEKAFEKIASHPFSKTLIHSDLGTSNILFDPKENRLAGIIDFGDMCLHDPARDFNGIYRNHGREFTEKVLQWYERPIEKNFWDRIDFYAKRQNFMIIFYAPKFAQANYIPAVAAAIENEFALRS